MKRNGFKRSLLALVAYIALWEGAWAQTPTWARFAFISPTTTLSAGRLCYTDGVGIACDATAPLASSLTSGLATDRIVSGTSSVVAANGGPVSITIAGTNVANFGAGGLGITNVNASGAVTASTLTATNIGGSSGSIVFRSNNGVLIGSSSMTINTATNQLSYLGNGVSGISSISGTMTIRVNGGPNRPLLVLQSEYGPPTFLAASNQGPYYELNGSNVSQTVGISMNGKNKIGINTNYLTNGNWTSNTLGVFPTEFGAGAELFLSHGGGSGRSGTSKIIFGDRYFGTTPAASINYDMNNNLWSLNLSTNVPGSIFSPIVTPTIFLRASGVSRTLGVNTNTAATATLDVSGTMRLTGNPGASECSVAGDIGKHRQNGNYLEVCSPYPP